MGLAPAQHLPHYSGSQSVPTADWPGGSLQVTRRQQSSLSYSMRVHAAHTAAHLECPGQVTGEAVPLGLPGHLLPHHVQEMEQLHQTHRNKLRRAANVRRQRNMPQMEEQAKPPQTELSEMEASKLPDTESKQWL